MRPCSEPATFILNQARANICSHADMPETHTGTMDATSYYACEQSAASEKKKKKNESQDFMPTPSLHPHSREKAQ